jgi:NADP-dependent 3-hydroxy acid dehydrogenase YdfG
MKLAGKRCIVTGASAGIGKAIAEEFAKDGCHLFIGARRIDRLTTIKSQLLEMGASAVDALPLDVQSDSSVNEFCDHALKSGPPDIVVNNAGLAIGLDHLSDGDVSDWQTVLDTNVTGVLRVTRRLLPDMKKNQNGHIIMLGSIAGHTVYEGGGVYCASKHAVFALTKTLKLELSGTNIRVTTIDPGLVETEFSQVRLKDSEKAKKVYNGLQPLTPQDIAECVYFAASRPAHVNIDDIIVMPTAQATVYKIDRK